MVALKFLLPFLAAAIITASTVEQVISDITTLDENIKALTAKVNSYNGGWWRALPQISAATPVFTALLAGGTTTSNLPQSLSVSDAYLIIDHVKATLAVDNPIAVNALKEKKEQYAKAKLANVMVAGLGLLKLGHENLVNNVLVRVPEEALEDGKKVALGISEALQDGIDTFQALS